MFRHPLSARTLPATLVSLLFLLSLSAADAAPPGSIQLRPIAAAPAVSAGAAGNTNPEPPDPRAEPLGIRLREAVGKLKAQAEAERRAAPVASTRQQQAIARLRARLGARLEIRGIEQSGTPRQIRGGILEKAANRGATPRERDRKTAQAFLSRQKELLRLDDPGEEMRLRDHREDELGRRHLRYAQHYRNLEVWPSELLVHIDPAGNVDGLDGAYVPTPRDARTTPVVSAEAAIRRARGEMPGGAEAKVDPPELIVYAPGDRPPRLAWKLSVEVSPASRWRVVIDALNGATLKAYDEVMEQGVEGSGRDLLNIPRSLNLWREGSAYYLVDTSKPMYDPASTPPAQVRGGIELLDARNRPPTDDPSGSLGDIPLAFVSSASADSGWLPDAVSAAHNLSETYDYFRLRHGRDSLDGEGGTLFAVVRYGKGYPNAFWNGQAMVFGDAEPYAAALDVVAHELAHGVTSRTANLEYVDQSGALNEAMSDIFGSAVEAYSRGGTDWLMGDVLSRPIRNLRDPASMPLCCGRNYPSKMSEFILPTDAFLNNFAGRDNGGVHINSSIVNRAFYLLAEGLNGAIGLEKAERIFYRALVFHLVKRSQFADARQAALASAEELFGAGSAEALKTAAAFDAVEILGGGSGTPAPAPIPAVSGSDSTLCVYYDAESGLYRLCRRENALGDPPEGVALSSWGAARAKASVSGDGSLAVVVNASNDACLVNTNTTGSTPADCLGMSGQIHSVAIAPSGDRFAFVFLDAFGDPENSISIIDLNSSNPKTLTLKATTEDGQPAEVVYADSMAFTADSRYLLYDAFNSITLAEGGRIGVWSIYALDTATDRFLTILPPTQGWDIEFPATGHTGTEHLAFEAVDQASGVSYVFTGNINTGDVVNVATVSDQYFAVPGFTGDDSALVYSVPDSTPTGTSLRKQALAADHLNAQGQPELWMTDAHYGVIYRRGDFRGAVEQVLNVAVAGSGSVSSAPAGISCGSDCQETYPQSTAVTLSAAPASGMAVVGWTGCDAVAGAVCTVYLTQDKSVTVQFTAIPPDNPNPNPNPNPGSDSPWDLSGTWKATPSQVCRRAGAAQKCRIKGTLRVRNESSLKVRKTALALFLSDDAALGGNDLRIARLAVAAIRRGKTGVRAFDVKLLPGMNATGRYLIAVLDADGVLAEKDEGNNRMVFGPLP